MRGTIQDHDHSSFASRGMPSAPPCPAGLVLVTEVTLVVSVGNILDSADVRSTGALEPPDLVVTEMQRNRGIPPAVF